MLQKCNLWNVATVFFTEPETPFELMTISKKIQLAHTSVKKHLHTLIELQIIKTQKSQLGNKNNIVYTAKKRHPNYIHYKKIHNINALYKSRIIDYLTEKCQPNSIVLFGSYAKGEDTKTSDIDLFVESQEEKLKLEDFEQILHRKIQIHFKSYFQAFPPELKNNILNGIVLAGYLEGYDA
ncbi:MAG: nucleotidyltransferase family protein [Candidatus Woesearchaeota archaeon]